MRGEMETQLLLKVVLLILGILLFTVLLFSVKSEGRNIDAVVLKHALELACKRGRYGINVSLDTRPLTIVDAVTGINERHYILNRIDPEAIYYYSMEPLEGYSWDLYAGGSGNISVADFGVGELKPGERVGELSEKLENYASSLGYETRLGVNVYGNGNGFLVIRNVIANNTIVSYGKGRVFINASSPLRVLAKYFSCGARSLCIRRGRVIEAEKLDCSTPPYLVEKSGIRRGEAILSEFMLVPPCNGVLSVAKGLCECVPYERPTILYDPQSDEGLVVDVERVCRPSWFNGEKEKVVCLKAVVESREGCYSGMMSRAYPCIGSMAGYEKGSMKYALSPPDYWSGYEGVSCIRNNARGSKYDYRWKS